MASGGTKGDKYRSFLDAENVKDIQWRFGAPPNYDVVNKLFEDGQTTVFFSNTTATYDFGREYSIFVHEFC